MKEKKFISALIVVSLLLSLLSSAAWDGITAKAADYGISNPRTDSEVTTWDCINFGNYWQNDTNGDGVADKKDAKQPIKWRVLSVNGNDAFLLADQNLDYLAYDDYDTYRDNITWEICTLRQWLNGEFYQNAFDSSEQSAVRTTNVVNEDNPFFETKGGNHTSDKVYMLSLSEVWNPAYGFSEADTYSETREAKNTAYVKACGAATVGSGSHVGNGEWWLRTPGVLQYFAVTVLNNGDVAYAGSAVGTLNLPGAAESKCAVRPALHLDLSSDKWSKADSISATIAGSRGGEEAQDPGGAKATPAPTSTPAPTVAPSTENKINKPIQPEIENKVTTTAPAKVTIKSAKNIKGRKLSLSWKKVKEADGYELQYADNKGFKKKKSKQIRQAKYTIKNCKKKKTYYIRIRAYKLDGKKKVYGNWSKVKKVKVKK